MQANPLGRSSLAQTAVVSLLTLAAVAACGLALAYWTWTWFAPRPEPRAEVVAAETGGSSDFTARLMAFGLTNALGQQVVVDNRGGHGI
ncbi:MAG: ABC transporter substrate-binding protein, partial [Proteobacteria bacterium]|nr:ABC transporter substrate-binding protein [Pseudomonadota bacterium]